MKTTINWRSSEVKLRADRHVNLFVPGADVLYLQEEDEDSQKVDADR